MASSMAIRGRTPETRSAPRAQQRPSRYLIDQPVAPATRTGVRTLNTRASGPPSRRANPAAAEELVAATIAYSGARRHRQRQPRRVRRRHLESPQARGQRERRLALGDRGLGDLERRRLAVGLELRRRAAVQRRAAGAA